MQMVIPASRLTEGHLNVCIRTMQRSIIRLPAAADGSRWLPCCADHRAVTQDRSFLGGGEPGPVPVRFACGQQMAVGLVRQALRRFCSQHTTVRVSNLRGQARIEGVSNGTLDLAVVTHDVPTIQDIARRTLACRASGDAPPGAGLCDEFSMEPSAAGGRQGQCAR